MDKTEILKGLNTRHLLGLLQKTREPQRMGIPIRYGEVVYFPNPADETIYLVFGAEEIRQVLKDREHVPNKQEARKIRQERAKK